MLPNGGGKSSMLSKLALFIASLCVGSVSGMPYFLINSPRAHCIQVQAPEETTLRVHYDAPGKGGKGAGGGQRIVSNASVLLGCFIYKLMHQYPSLSLSCVCI